MTASPPPLPSALPVRVLCRLEQATPAERAILMAWIEQGFSFSRAAVHLGRSRKTVARVVRRYRAHVGEIVRGRLAA